MNQDELKTADHPADSPANETDLSILLHKIQANPDSIKAIEEPAENLQLLAINDKPDTIQFIKNPCESVQRLAIQLQPDTIQYFYKIASPEIRMMALERDPTVIRYFEDAKLDEQKYVIARGEENWDLIQNPDLKADWYWIRKYVKPLF